MEENNGEKTQEKKKSTRKKKEVNSRIADVLQRLDIEEKEQKIDKPTQKNKKEEIENGTSKKKTTLKTNKVEKNTEKKLNKGTKVEKNTEKNKTISNKEEIKSKKENKSAKEETVNKKENKSQKEEKASNKKEKKLPKEENVSNKKEKKTQKEKRSKRVNKEIELSDEEKMQKIEEEINNQKKLPKEIKGKINKKIFANLLMAIAISIYLIFINLGYTNINEAAFITDLQVFSITLIITTVIIFEQAYKKDSGKLTIYGIEVLILSIITMVLPRIYNEYKHLFVDIVGIATIAYISYYIIKSVIIYVKARRKIRKRDIKKIAKK